MRKVGIASVIVYPNRARVRVSTRVGEVYFRYPSALAPTDFAIYVGAQDLEADSDGYNAGTSAQYEAAIKAVLPEAVRRTDANNIWAYQQSISGGGGGRGGR